MKTPAERAANKRWKKANPEKLREYERRRRAKHAHVRERDRERSREWKRKNAAHVKESKRLYHLANPERARAWVRRSKYGITAADFESMVAAQGGRCAICAEPHSPLRVDHDHATDQVRGLLCHHCNVALGHMRDSPQRLRAAAAYLENTRSPIARVA